MVALTAVLGPRDAPGTYNWTGGPNQPVVAVPIPVRPGWDVFVSAAPDAASAGTSLGTFEHNSATDSAYTLNHAVVDHIRSLLYPRKVEDPTVIIPPAVGPTIPPAMYSGTQPIGSMFPLNFTDLQVIRIKRFGITMTATHMTVAEVTMAVAGTATLAPKLQPGDVTSAVNQNIFASNNPSIATVADTGVVTGVSPGTTQIKVTNKSNGLVAEAQVTVTGTTLLFRTGAPEAETVVSEDGKKTYTPYNEPAAKAQTVEGEPKSQGFVLNKVDGGDTSGKPKEITKAESAKASIQGDEPVTTPENTPNNDPDEEYIDEDEEVSVGEISGIGPATEAKLVEVGITTARQIAELSEEEADQLDDELGLGGRIRRDDWIGQAKELIK